MSKLRAILAPFQQYGIHIYLLFALYSVTVAPYITRFTNFGEKNHIVAILGIFMYVAEYFAFKYKLNMIRLDMELKQMDLQKFMKLDLKPPYVGPAIWCGTFMRIFFRIGFLIISIMAMGINTNNPFAGIIAIGLLGLLVAEVLLFGKLTVVGKSGLFREYAMNKKEEQEHKEEDEKWRNENLILADSAKHGFRDFLADIVLYLYAFMVYTVFWEFVNNAGIKMVEGYYRTHEPAAIAISELMMMLFGMTLVGMIPMRLAHWIKETVMAFTKKEKWKLRFYFLMAVLFTCAPSIAVLIKLYFQKG